MEGTILTILIPVVVGAVIGYITNYLAIRMLFRPLTPKYLFGWKLPFTPGLIPKERDHLAFRIGQTVKEYLLTEEAVLRHLESAHLLDRLQTALAGFLLRETKKDTTIGEVLEARAGVTADALSPAVARFLIRSRFFGWADAQTAAKRLSPVLERALLDNDGWLDPLLQKGRDALAQAVNRGELDEAATDALWALVEKKSGLTLEKALPEPVLLGILSQYNEREDALVSMAKKLLLSPRVTATVRQAAQDTAEQHLARPLRRFLRPEGIGSRVTDAYTSYIESADSERLLKDNLRGVVETLLHTPLSELTASLEKEKLNGWTREFLEGSVVFLHRDSVAHAVKEKIASHTEFFSHAGAGAAASVLAEMLALQTEESTSEFVTPLLSKLMETRTADMIKSFGDDAPQKLAFSVTDFIRTILPGIVKDGVARFGVDTLVEEQIKRFDVKMLEEVIIDVADRELKAITALGALLGAVMGLIQPLLQRLM